MSKSDIQVIVKAPNQKLEDQVVVVSLEWNVLKLKRHLSFEYPNKPAIGEQRLIYSGHLLRDEQLLRDVFRPLGEDNVTVTFTVHLVCSQRIPDPTKLVPNRQVIMTPSTTSSPAIDPNANGAQTPADANIQQVNNRQAQENGAPAYAGFFESLQSYQWNPATGAANFSPGIPMMTPVTPEQMLQQVAAMQQMYAQYMAQYLNQPGVNLTQVNAFPAANLPPGTGAPSPVVPQPPAQADPRPQPQPQVARMNAGPAGAAADDDDDLHNRDWLDWFYWMSRAIVLFSIVYFYSSFTRFMLVVGLSLAMYLYQVGWLFPRPDPEVNRNEERDVRDNAQNENQEDATPADEAEREAEARRIEQIMDGNLDRPRRSPQPQEVASTQPTEERFSGLRLFWVIVSSLFTSLIPDQPPAAVNMN